jgi:hypothetical protein
MRGFAVLAATACVGISFSIASAATLETYQVGNWQSAAYSDDQTGAFDHCAMSASYSTGNMLLFAINSNFAWSVGVLNNGWTVPPDSTHNITYSINGGILNYSTGRAVTGTEIEFPIPADEDLYNRFRYGSRIIISVMGQQLFFPLEGTQRGLAALVDCAQRHASAAAPPGTLASGTAPPGVSKPTVPGTQGMPTTSPPVASGLSVDAVVLMANVLAQSALTGYRLAQSSEVPPELAGYQAVWSAPNLRGFLAAPATPVGNISGDLIARDAKACTGSFSSGTLPDDKSSALGTGVVRVYTSCDGGSGAAVTYYMVLPKSGGGQYIFAEIGAAGSQSVVQDAEAKIRKAVDALLR